MRDNLNLVSDRGPSVWNRHDDRTWERLGLPSLLLAASVAGFVIAGWLLYRLVRVSKTPASPGQPSHADDQVNHASEQSFPASDAPSWTALGAMAEMPERTM